MSDLGELRKALAKPVPRDIFAAVCGKTVEKSDLKHQRSSLKSLDVDFGHGGSYIALE